MLSLSSVWRGEHGPTPLQTRHASLTFVNDRGAAEQYALNPNVPADIPTAVHPRLIEAQLTMRRPLVQDIHDPFIDFTVLAEGLGQEAAERIFCRHDDYVRHTSRWEDVQDQFHSVKDLIDRAPELLETLYVQLWPLLDCPETIAEIKGAGFDGAIYRSSGATMDAVEYRVFDPSQIEVLQQVSLGVEEVAPDEPGVDQIVRKRRRLR